MDKLDPNEQAHVDTMTRVMSIELMLRCICAAMSKADAANVLKLIDSQKKGIASALTETQRAKDSWDAVYVHLKQYQSILADDGTEPSIH